MTAASKEPGGGAGPARWRAFTALVALERGRTERLRDALRVDDLAARDRALALELALATERRRITLDAVLTAFAARGALPRDPFVRTAVRMGALQVLYLPRIPPHAAVHGTVALLRAQRGFVNGILRRLARSVVARIPAPGAERSELALPPDPGGAPRTLVLPAPLLPDPEREPAAALAVAYGLPEFLVARWLAAFDLAPRGPAIAGTIAGQRLPCEQTAAIAAASAASPGVTLRVNRTRTDAPALQAALGAEGVATRRGPDDLTLDLAGSEGPSPFATSAWHQGLFAVQDRTALAAALAVAARPGETILDLCAAPGGKTTALAEAMAGRGVVFAHDVAPERLARVREAAARLGLQDVVRVVDDLAAVPAPVDAVLVDAPCSNTGVLARRVELRRRLAPAAIAELAGRQAELLSSAVRLARPGGRVVYSTCSLEPEENRAVVDAQLAATPGLRLLVDRLTLPVAGSHDGGYFAVLLVAGGA